MDSTDTQTLTPIFHRWNIGACFYPLGAGDTRVLAVVVCLCVTVCLSHAGIVSKRLNVGSRKQRHVIALGLYFSDAESPLKFALKVTHLPFEHDTFDQ